MAKRSIQGYVELASGLGELTRSAAKEAAAEIVALAGSDASRKKAAKQVSGLADELLQAARSNRKALVRLVRREVDAAVAKLDVNRLSAEVQTLGATVAGLAAQVDDLARSATGLSARTPSPVADALADIEVEPARVAPRPSAPAKKAPVKRAPAKKAPARPGRRRPRRRRPRRRRPRRRRPRRRRRRRRRRPPRHPRRATATKTAAKKAPATKAPATVDRHEDRRHEGSRPQGPGPQGPAGHEGSGRHLRCRVDSCRERTVDLHHGRRVTEQHPDTAPDGAPEPGAPPETGDIVIDAALRDLAAAPHDDLDAQLEAGEAVHRTLQSRLTDLGG